MVFAVLLAERVVTHIHIEDFVSVLLDFDSVIVGVIPHFNSVMALFPGRLLPEPCYRTSVFVYTIQACLFVILRGIGRVFRLVPHGMVWGCHGLFRAGYARRARMCGEKLLENGLYI